MAYATWLSVTLHLRVLRAYLNLVSGELNQFIQPNIQHENYWFKLRPHWPAVRTKVLNCYAYRDIAAALEISRASVARAVRSMIRVGLLSPWQVAERQSGPARKAAQHYSKGWGVKQLSLFG